MEREQVEQLVIDVDNYKRAAAHALAPRPVDMQVLWYSVAPLTERAFNQGVTWGSEYTEMLLLGNDVY